VSTLGYRNVSFRRPEQWTSFAPALQGTHLDGVAAGTTSVLIGDGARGPLIVLTALPPDEAAARTPAHMHASDSWRISLKGSMEMGKEAYAPGEFRFQEGWRPYPSDSFAQGPEGGWGLLIMGDRRGVRARMVGEELPGLAEAHRALALHFGITGDLVSDEPSETAGHAGLATTLGAITKGGKLVGSFADAGGWPEVSEQTRAHVSLLGAPDCGPLLVLAATSSGGLAAPGSTWETDTFRLVVSGSCTIGDEHYESGDARIQEAGVRCDPVVAGPDGLRELVVIGDRRACPPELDADPTWWSHLDAVAGQLRDRLDDRGVASSVR
jgi:hypothetical protein